MDWKDLGKKVATFAPVLGSALGPGGTAVGALIASAFGVENTPEAIDKAIAADPGAVARLRELELTHQYELSKLTIEAETARISEVNATMRAEAQSEKWPQYWWRPYWGFTSGTAFLFLTIFVCQLAKAAVFEGKPEAMMMIPQLIGAFATLFAIPAAILGVASWHRGKEKRINAGEQSAPGLLANLVNLKGK